MSQDDKAYLFRIKEARETNNDLWMGILEIALKSSPEETRHLINRIRKYDALIGHYMKKLGEPDEDSG